MKFVLALAIFFTIFVYPLELLARDNSLGGFARRFVSGVTNSRGSIQDHLIEGAIEASTPEADENTRKIQRNAVKLMLTNNPNKSDRLWRNIRNDISKTSMRNAKRSASQRDKRREMSSDGKHCTITNLGILPGKVIKASGCLSGNCIGWTGKFQIDGMGSGISGAFTDYPMIVDTSMDVTIDSKIPQPKLSFFKKVRSFLVSYFGDIAPVERYRASLEMAGFQLWERYKHILVTARGNLLTFSADDKTTHLGSDDKEVNDLGVLLNKSRNKGEWFSILFSRKGNGVVNWGYMRVYLSPSVIRECK